MVLAAEHCVPCRKGEGKLSEAECLELLGNLPDWTRKSDAISRRYIFKNFAQALAFVNHVGEVAEAQNHHPDITFGWGYAECLLTTHSVGGLTRNDFIVAAKIDALAGAQY